jgi:hypothetical protein
MPLARNCSRFIARIASTTESFRVPTAAASCEPTFAVTPNSPARRVSSAISAERISVLVGMHARLIQVSPIISGIRSTRATLQPARALSIAGVFPPFPPATTSS